MLAKDLLVKDVASVDTRKDILDALFAMFTSRQYVLPVFDKSKFVGTVSISNYAKVLRDFMHRKPESIYVSEIMDEKPITVSPTTDISYFVDKLSERGVHGVAVLSGHDLIGMIRRGGVLKHFMHLLKGKFKVMDVMSHQVSTGSIHDTVENVAKRLITGDERRIVIMNYKKIEGVLYIKDLANILLAEKADLSTMSVKDILIPNTLTVRKSDDVTKAVEIMLDWQVTGVPVVGEELEGIVKDKDIIQRLRFIL